MRPSTAGRSPRQTCGTLIAAGTALANRVGALPSRCLVLVVPPSA
jgi:hypothetical protein